MQRKVLKVWGAALTVCLIVIIVSLFARTAKTQSGSDAAISEDHRDSSSINKEVLSKQLGVAIRENTYPTSFKFNVDGTDTQAKVQYTLHEPSQAMMQKLLGQYKPDYGAFVAMDAKTGRVLSMVSFSEKHAGLDNLTLRATFPSASIFKVVTASAAIDMNKAVPNTIVPFNGGLHTLFKKNVESTQLNRWTRKMTMREAFGKSVNVIFSKLGLFYVGPQNLQMYAERYFFNHAIRADVPVQVGMAKFSSDDPWSVATAASGYTRDNTMSPLQGALIAAAVANDGVMMEPFIVENLMSESGALLYQGEPHQASVVVEPQSAENLRELFKQTVRSGTSRKSFRQTVRRSLYDDIEFGGKTGSLTGKDPQGKVDWFVGYARYHDQRIAVAALTVNEKKWKVKSSMLANLFFQKYFKDLKRDEKIASAK
jgi:peptidoglycan glycosyltransferase